MVIKYSNTFRLSNGDVFARLQEPPLKEGCIQNTELRLLMWERKLYKIIMVSKAYISKEEG